MSDFDLTDVHVLKRVYHALQGKPSIGPHHAWHGTDLTEAEGQAALRRLAAEGYIVGQQRPSKTFYRINEITGKGLPLVAGYPYPQVTAEVPNLDALTEQITQFIPAIEAALQAEPDHPKAPKLRKFLAVARDTSVDITAKVIAEVAKGSLA